MLDMKFLVTGGAGFIGLNYLKMSLKKHPEDEFVCLDALTYASSYSELEPLLKEKNLTFVKGDITDRALVYRLFEQYHFDIVINFAAETHVDRSIVDPSIFYKTNIYGLSVLLDACRIYGVKRFHEVSTDEVYGSLPLFSGSSFKETDLLNPSSPYSASKASGDLLTLAYRRTYGVPISISRSSNNYGKYQHEEKLIPSFIKKAAKNELLPLYGDGQNIRDWLYVEDNCRAIDLIARSGKEGEIYNIAAHNELSNLEIVKMILSYMGKDDGLLRFVADRPGHDERYSLNTTKIEKELAWKAEKNFLDGLKETIDWYRKGKR